MMHQSVHRQFISAGACMSLRSETRQTHILELCNSQKVDVFPSSQRCLCQIFTPPLSLCFLDVRFSWLNESSVPSSCQVSLINLQITGPREKGELKQQRGGLLFWKASSRPHGWITDDVPSLKWPILSIAALGQVSHRVPFLPKVYSGKLSALGMVLIKSFVIHFLAATYIQCFHQKPDHKAVVPNFLGFTFVSSTSVTLRQLSTEQREGQRRCRPERPAQ